MDLTLYAESQWVSPWVFHAMVALEEKHLPYKLEVLPLPVPSDLRGEWLRRGLVAKVPMLVHGDTWISESLAISEYLAERFPTPGHPRIFPADLAERARARQVMSMMRTGFFALREERPTSSIFGRAVGKPLGDKARADADELVRIASQLIAPGRTTMFPDWCIADADLTLMLMRLVANNDPVPKPVEEYVNAQWSRPSSRKFMSNVPTMR
jgi:glutathione S-transferase